jgi:hypothetical protein
MTAHFLIHINDKENRRGLVGIRIVLLEGLERAVKLLEFAML